MPSGLKQHKIGWIGAGGRMGYRDGGAARQGGRRCRGVEPHPRQGRAARAKAAARWSRARPALADRDIVFVTVAASHDLKEVTLGAHGVLTGRPSSRRS